jgi:hypothetical protein
MMRNVALFSPVLATALAQVQTPPLGVVRVLVLYIVVDLTLNMKLK